MANNPALLVTTLLKSLRAAAPIDALLSVGCGIAPSNEASGPRGVANRVLASATDTERQWHAVRVLLPHSVLLRLQPSINAVALNDPREGSRRALLHNTESYMTTQLATLECQSFLNALVASSRPQSPEIDLLQRKELPVDKVPQQSHDTAPFWWFLRILSFVSLYALTWLKRRL